MNFPHWRCQVCKQPIRAEDGEVEIWHDRAYEGSEKKWEVRIEEARDPDHGMVSLGSMAEGWAEDLERASVSLKVHHYDCRPGDPPEEEDVLTYGIPLTQVDSLQLWVVKVYELLSKVWIGKWEAKSLLLFWWQHKGEPVPGR